MSEGKEYHIVIESVSIPDRASAEYAAHAASVDAELGKIYEKLGLGVQARSERKGTSMEFRQETETAHELVRLFVEEHFGEKGYRVRKIVETATTTYQPPEVEREYGDIAPDFEHYRLTSLKAVYFVALENPSDTHKETASCEVSLSDEGELIITREETSKRYRRV